MSNLKEFNDLNFKKEVLESEVPVLVDFWAPWCGPCQMISPVITQLAEEFAGKAVVGKVNVDENINTPGQYGVLSIPTIVLFKNGKEAQRIVGFRPKGDLQKELESLL